MTTFDPAHPRRGDAAASRQPRPRLFVAATAVVLVAGIVAPVAALGGGGKDRPQYDIRLDEAFRAAHALSVDGAVLERVRAAAGKSDRLATLPDCGAQTWPAIHPQCLISADGSTKPAARTVTVEYRLGERTSVLVRLPLRRTAQAGEALLGGAYR